MTLSQLGEYVKDRACCYGWIPQHAEVQPQYLNYICFPNSPCWVIIEDKAGVVSQQKRDMF